MPKANLQDTVAEAEDAEVVQDDTDQARLQDDFNSITVQLDHLLDYQGKSVVAVVFSSESAVESLAAQLDYFGQAGRIQDKSTVAMLNTGHNQAVGYVFTPNEQRTNVIFDKALFDRAFAAPDLGNLSWLNTFASMVALAVDIKRAARAEGRDDSLLVYVPDLA